MVCKKHFSIIITMFICLFSLIGLTSCDFESDGPVETKDNSIILTVDNIQTYINLSVYPDLKCHDYKYHVYDFGGRATVTGITGYSYNNVSITIKVGFNHMTKSREVTFTVKCNIGGNGSGGAKHDTQVIGLEGDWIIACAYYKIVSVTGTCTRD